jgi:hypothetical protein
VCNFFLLAVIKLGTHTLAFGRGKKFQITLNSPVWCVCAQSVLPGDAGMRADEFFSRQRTYREEFACGATLFWSELKLPPFAEKGTLFLCVEMRKCTAEYVRKKYSGEQQGTVCHNFLSHSKGEARALSSFGTSISAERAQELLLDVGVNARNLFL